MDRPATRRRSVRRTAAMESRLTGKRSLCMRRAALFDGLGLEIRATVASRLLAAVAAVIDEQPCRALGRVMGSGDVLVRAHGELWVDSDLECVWQGLEQFLTRSNDFVQRCGAIRIAQAASTQAPGRLPERMQPASAPSNRCRARQSTAPVARSTRPPSSSLVHDHGLQGDRADRASKSCRQDDLQQVN